jgi:hypothetical protein
LTGDRRSLNHVRVTDNRYNYEEFAELPRDLPRDASPFEIVLPPFRKELAMGTIAQKMGGPLQGFGLHGGAIFRPLIVSVLAIWFVLVFLLGAMGMFVQPPESPPLPILLGATIPLLVFAAGYLGWSAFREAVLAADLPLLAATQAWRAGGLGFLALYTYDVLPGMFAWPAGLGDIAIGVTAPWIVIALVREPAFVKSPRFVIWNLLGILDLVLALSMGALSSGFVNALRGEATTTPMARLPLVLIPAFLVPLFIMFHIAGLLQARREVSFRADEPAAR